MEKRYYIENVGISVTNLNFSVKKICDNINSGRKSNYVCVTNVRAVYYGNHDDEYCRILNESLLTVPDGKPLEWYARIMGIKEVEKTSGNDLFDAVCKESEVKGYSHFFLGSTPKVIELMKDRISEKYPRLNVVGFVSPPYGSASELLEDRLLSDINALKPDIIWIGLGAPKQERFIDLIKNKVDVSVLIGVGLVFEYQAGTVSRAPLWMCDAGLEWLYIWFQQPKKIMRSYPYFVYFLSLLLSKRFKRSKL